MPIWILRKTATAERSLYMCREVDRERMPRSLRRKMHERNHAQTLRREIQYTGEIAYAPQDETATRKQKCRDMSGAKMYQRPTQDQRARA